MWHIDQGPEASCTPEAPAGADTARTDRGVQEEVQGRHGGRGPGEDKGNWLSEVNSLKINREGV